MFFSVFSVFLVSGKAFRSSSEHTTMALVYDFWHGQKSIYCCHSQTLRLNDGAHAMPHYGVYGQTLCCCAAEFSGILGFFHFLLFKQLVKVACFPAFGVFPTLEILFKEAIAIKAFCGQAGKEVVENTWGSALEHSMHPVMAELCGWSDYALFQQWLVQH